MNRALRFSRTAAYGHRLDIPAGTSLRFEPGEGRDVDLVPLTGSRTVFGMSALVNGSLDGERDQAIDEMRTRKFLESS